MGSSTVAPLEIAWTAISALALLFSIWLAVNGWRDFAAVCAAIAENPPRARRWGPRWWLGLSAWVANTALSLVWLGFATVGMLAMTAGPDSDVVYRAWVASITGWTLIGMTLLLALVQAWHLYVRGRVEQTSRGVL